MNFGEAKEGDVIAIIDKTAGVQVYRCHRFSQEIHKVRLYVWPAVM